MTIELTVQSRQDAFSGDPLVMLRRDAFSSEIRLATAEWTVARNSGPEPFQQVLNSVFSQITARLPNHEIWLLIGDTAWQPDTRIVRYRKKFNALKAQGIDFEAITDRFEYAIEDDGKLKFFGAVHLDESVLMTVPLTMPPRACTYVVAQPKGIEKPFALSSGWTGQWNADAALIELIAQCGGIAFQRVGFFDDSEVGLLAVGNPDALAQILS
ncbi:hypothetical protein [Burkholderia ambifaria]|uniref:hypothetical protein n=2 Tax=Burkholderia ambifaria TaxID=152480 RepID=UPI0013FD689E|nr:hypothetical protein [Burkholderia ambifaria]NHL70725.1 hypothetical protein [Burkholderia ambifaria]WAS58924.1 hypothetical protein MK974_29675 [Burkholderia ambifaria]